jgi:hypothetical protein
MSGEYTFQGFCWLRYLASAAAAGRVALKESSTRSKGCVIPSRSWDLRTTLNRIKH